MNDGRSFCAIVLGDKIKRLIIPPPFVAEHGVFFPPKVTLQTDGKSEVSWPVGVGRTGGGRYYLTDGWRKFAKGNALEFANFLLLRFIEDSRIVVSVFNRNGLKRKTAVFRFTWRDCKKNCMLIALRVCKAIRLRDATHAKLRNTEGRIFRVKLFNTNEDRDGRVGLGDGWAAFVDFSDMVEEQTYQFECMRCDKKIQMQLSLVQK